MYQVITVVYTNRKLNAFEANQQKKYAFIYDGPVKKGDLLQSPNYATAMQVISVEQRDKRTITRNGSEVVLKNLVVDFVNGVSVENKNNNKSKEMAKKNSMFAGIVDKYKSQYYPEREDGVKMAMDGTLCVAVGSEYIGMKADGTLTSYPREMLIEFPVFSINKPSSQVQIGDIVKNGNGYGKVMMKNPDGSLKILSYTGYTHNKQEVQDFLLGQAMTRVLVNAFAFNTTGFNPLIFAMCDEDNEFDMKDLFMLQAITGNNMFGGNSMNPLMMMAFANKDGEGFGNDMFSLMAMSQMMGGQNPFQNITAPKVENDKPTASFDVNAFVENLKKNPDLANQIKTALNAE